MKYLLAVHFSYYLWIFHCTYLVSFLWFYTHDVYNYIYIKRDTIIGLGRENPHCITMYRTVWKSLNLFILSLNCSFEVF